LAPVHGSFPVSVALPSAAREQLAKDWVARIVDRTPLTELGSLPLRELAEEAPQLIATICAALAGSGPARELNETERAHVAKLATLRPGPDGPTRVSEDLAELQALLVRVIETSLGARAGGELARAAARLAEVFGSIHGAVAGELVATLAEDVADPVTGLPGPAQLDHFLAMLLAEQRRYGHPFAFALVDIDGLARTNETYGRAAGDRMLIAVAAVLRRQLRAVDRVFRLEEDEFAVVAPHTLADGLATMAKRAAKLITGTHTAEGPRIAIAVGIVECPADGVSAERLLEGATEATYAAKASGAPVARKAAEPQRLLQDP